MYQAPLLALGLVCIAVWRKVLLSLENSHHKKHENHPEKSKGDLWHLVGHYYTPLYLAFIWFTVFGIWNMITLISPVGFLLDAAAVNATFASEPDGWYPEISFIEDSVTGKLAVYLALSTPLWLVLTLFFSVYHTLTHVKRVQSYPNARISKHILHDKAIQIIALPTMYALMAFKSVCRMFQVIMNDTQGHLAHVEDHEGHHTFEGRKEMLTTLYETNFSVADLYEAWALYHFAMLAIKVISDCGEEKGQAEVEKVKQAGAGEEEVKNATEVAEMGNKLATGIDQITAQGIYGFVIVCICQSLFNLGMTAPEFYGWLSEEAAHNLHHATWPTSLKLSLKGAGLLASTMAISNVVTVEVTFHEWLHEFSPASKFWSTKILVSLAFAQSLILCVPPFSSLSVTGQNLFYASLLVFECFGVSLLHVYAWPADEEWYEKDADGAGKEQRAKEFKAHGKKADSAYVIKKQSEKTKVSPYVGPGARGREPETPYIQLTA